MALDALAHQVVVGAVEGALEQRQKDSMPLVWTGPLTYWCRLPAASNPAVRDQATTALVNLLTERLEAASRRAGRFTDVNDPCVFERAIAVAYGVATRCHDPD